MHMADALVNPAVAGTMYVASAAVAAYSIKKVRQENDARKIPLMGIMGAFVFAAQMLNFTIPGTGSSGHLCGGLLLAALLGPYAAFLTMIAILTIQCLLFADGGLLALGCNIWNMAFYGCFIGYFGVWQPLLRSGASKAKIIAASVLGSVLTLQLGSLSVAVETTLSGITELPFGVFAVTMQSIHLAIGAVEGMIIACVLLFIYDARPELIDKNNAAAARFSYKKTLAALAAAAFLFGGAFSLAASENPDGLEWSLGQVAGTEELDADSPAHAQAAAIQEAIALLPDYAFKDSDSAYGTVFSGVFGSAVVILVGVGACVIGKFFRHQKYE
ncbi:MAG: energy-coupling factor ABC transporter permease [Phascolarctobacterium sp.]|uniref:energy-coupling factor ABC transporter permease n=1 Tax=Phascolarctobacterium sp. TaxID=2049039 RepID=UPI0026DBBC96|nr:energy-coupling factor ABC transporter permease [Phascolarctobacterium sp.]MDO4921709.1 energy-coupling factor ABC transporter permease [Phascolarctobacterium sp.]